LTLKKINKDDLLIDMCSQLLSLKSNNINVPGTEPLFKTLTKYCEKVSAKKLAVATMIFNAYLWGQQYERICGSKNPSDIPSSIIIMEET